MHESPGRSVDNEVSPHNEVSLHRGATTLVVARRGAAVQVLRVGDRDVFQPAVPGETAAFTGCVLTPWPNRIADGRYRFAGVEYQLPINEPETGSALHGLGWDVDWRVLDVGSDDKTEYVDLRLDATPVDGYPFHVVTTVRYTLVDDGIRVDALAENVGRQPCPYALGFHPYLSAGRTPTGGEASVDDCTLRLGVRRRFLTDARQIPVGDVAADGWLDGYPLAGRRLDDGFFDVVVENDGLAHARLSRPDGFVVDLWAEPVFAFWQVYTGDKRAAAYARRGVAVEPMTAAPNAFNNHQGLLILAPGESFSAAWGVTLRPADADGRD